MLVEVLVQALRQYCTAAEQEEGTWQELRLAERAGERRAALPGLPTGLVLLKGELLPRRTNFEGG